MLLKTKQDFVSEIRVKVSKSLFEPFLYILYLYVLLVHISVMLQGIYASKSRRWMTG